MQQFLTRQFYVFLITGGTSAAVNFSSRIIYNHWVDFSTAVVLAYLTGMVTAFVLAKLFVFKNSQQNIHCSIAFFCLVNLMAVAQTLAISMTFAYYVLPYVRVTLFAPEIAHAVGVVVPVFSSYIGHKRWSFR